MWQAEGVWSATFLDSGYLLLQWNLAYPDWCNCEVLDSPSREETHWGGPLESPQLRPHGGILFSWINNKQALLYLGLFSLLWQNTSQKHLKWKGMYLGSWLKESSPSWQRHSGWMGSAVVRKWGSCLLHPWCKSGKPRVLCWEAELGCNLQDQVLSDPLPPATPAS